MEPLEKERKQLNILNDINSMMEYIQADIWLRGGWGIDFILGKITRPHSDLDLVTWVQFRERIEELLVQAGFQMIPVSELQTDFLKDNIDISFVFVTKSSEGFIVANGIPDWVWRTDALSSKKYVLEGITAKVLSPNQLLEEKKVYEQGTGRKPRPKDLISMEILKKIIDVSLN